MSPAIQVYILVKLFRNTLLKRTDKLDKLISLPVCATNSQLSLHAHAIEPVHNFNGNIDPFPTIIAANQEQP